jgi:hypothetical protein
VRSGVPYAAMSNPERSRMATSAPWRRWGPYLAERAWGTVREDYSPGGTAWDSFPHDHARSRAYRWSEDGLGGICDSDQRLCFAFSFWNGRDAILKERLFGLTGPQGNHGEDAKECWWFTDATPSHAYLAWRYAYPQAAFPYERLVEVNARRGRDDPEFELLDTGVFDGDRYWDVLVEYAKASPTDICIRVEVRNAGPDEASLDVLPTLWFRNTWTWEAGSARPSLRPYDRGIEAEHPTLGRVVLATEPHGEPLFCDNESNARRLWGIDGSTEYPKDGINDHVVGGLPTVNPARVGTKAALRFPLTVRARETAVIRLRMTEALDGPAGGLSGSWERTIADRRAEADDFHDDLARNVPAQHRPVLRQALAGMIWSKQFYHYDVERWLEGDPGQTPPPPERWHGRNAGWLHLSNHNIVSMPDTWEYPWYAAWDLAFQCVALAHVDPGFAKHQLLLLCREWYMHPNGQLPAYEWAFGDVNPPVQAWAALRVFQIDGLQDLDFLERIFHKLLLNFTWWVNRKDAAGNNVFEGGFLGLDNVGPFDRSSVLPQGVRLEQSDGTAWMAMFALNMLVMALFLSTHDETYQDMATKFFEHFCYIASAMNEHGLWDEENGFYYDVLHDVDSGRDIRLEVRSVVGLIPLAATTTLSPATLTMVGEFEARLHWFLQNRPKYAAVVAHDDLGDDGIARLLSVVGPDRLRRILSYALSPDEFLSGHGLRSLSRFHAEHPFVLEADGGASRVDYEPGESTSGLFGGNSNWRGPVWFPTNHLVIESLRRFHRYLGDGFTVEYPTGSGTMRTLREVADDLSLRLISLFLNDRDGRRPAFGSSAKLQGDPAWHDRLLFFEYFHGETGMGLGASHQTGWTGLVADLILSLADPSLAQDAAVWSVPERQSRRADPGAS